MNDKKIESDIPNYKLFTKNIVAVKKSHIHQHIDTKVINYKNIDLLKTFITEDKGRILSSRLSGISSKNQRKIAKSIRQARQLLLLP